MYNLVQAQEALQGMPTTDVMKYANSQNAQVPAYLALAELNRRKQLEDTASQDRKSTRLNSSHIPLSRMPSSA